MQDEVNEKTMALCIKGGKISAQILKAALTKLLAEIAKKKQQSKKMGGQNRCKRGKQSIKSLQQSGAQLTNIVVTDNNIKSFDRVARKWNVDYAFYKTGPDKYLLFFKSGQADAMTACFSEYSRKVLDKSKSRRVPIREQLKRAADQLAKEKPRQKERVKEAAHADR